MRRIKLLVASRIEVDRELIRHFLRSEGYELCFAVNGADALDLLRYNPGFDLVIADVSLAVAPANGRQPAGQQSAGLQPTGQQRVEPANAKVDITNSIRAVDPYIPLIGMTAFPLDWLLKQNIGSGVDAWLLKPFSRDMLERVIWKALVCVA